MSVASLQLIGQKIKNSITPEVLNTLYSSMAPRMQAMDDNNGGHTKYYEHFSIILNVFYQ